MFFSRRFDAIAEGLDAKFRGASYAGQNPADKGELCEMIVQEALGHLISGRLLLHRGGKVVDSTGKESRQCDIVITSRDTVPAFEAKGLYPVEAVYAIVHVTSSLDSAKLRDSVRAVQSVSIPKANARFAYLFDWDNVKAEHAVVFLERLPYQVVFAFAGDLADADVAGLEAQADQGPVVKNALPHLIVINKKVMLEKVISKDAQFVGGGKVESHFAKVSLEKMPGVFLTVIASELGKLSTWDQVAMPAYEHYFNADLAEYFRGN